MAVVNKLHLLFSRPMDHSNPFVTSPRVQTLFSFGSSFSKDRNVSLSCKLIIKQRKFILKPDTICVLIVQ